MLISVFSPADLNNTSYGVLCFTLYEIKELLMFGFASTFLR